MPSLPSDQVIPRYETLRADILAAQPCLDHGWGLFLYRGMLAWSQSHNPQAGGPPRPSRDLGNRPLPEGLNRSVIQVLAGMVLQVQQEIAYGD